MLENSLESWSSYLLGYERPGEGAPLRIIIGIWPGDGRVLPSTLHLWRAPSKILFLGGCPCISMLFLRCNIISASQKKGGEVEMECLVWGWITLAVSPSFFKVYITELCFLCSPRLLPRALIYDIYTTKFAKRSNQLQKPQYCKLSYPCRINWSFVDYPCGVMGTRTMK
jgi:hypothetical protein